MAFGRNHIHCIIPPHMLERIIEQGDTKQRALALRALMQGQTLREERSLLQRQPSLIRPRMLTGLESFTAKKIRRVYDAQCRDNLPGVLVRDEGGGSVEDDAVNEAYEGTGHAWDLFWKEYKRNSIDDAGMPLISTVHICEWDTVDSRWEDVNNAFWNGEQMVYGDGDGQIFTRFTIDIDITAHELTHGVTDYTAKLVYQFQPGALNEHFSDVFGSLCKQRVLGLDVKEADWLIGEKVLIGDKYALRSMKAPGTAYVNHPIIGTDPQPANMDNYLDLPIWNDRGGVHINSGIPNHAFYLAAMRIGGFAWQKTGVIWYKTLAHKLHPSSSFINAAESTIAVAREEYGSGSLEEKAVREAWEEVKVI